MGLTMTYPCRQARVRYAVRHPERVPRYVRRLARRWDDTARDPEAAVGSASHERWLAPRQAAFALVAYMSTYSWPDSRMTSLMTSSVTARSTKRSRSMPS